MTTSLHSDISSPGVARPVAAGSLRKTGTTFVIRRLFQDYIRSQWLMFCAALVCMIVASAASGMIPIVVNYTVKHLFIQKQANMLVMIPLLVIALMTIRALSWYGQQSLIDSVGERVVTA